MINPIYWPRVNRVQRAVADYPLYDVPHKQAEGTLQKAKIDENFAYFMDVRLERLAFFQKWLFERFGVEAPLAAKGVLNLDRWANKFGGGLMGHTRATAAAEIFTSYRPDWLDERRGFNTIVDIAIFVGEFLISRRSNLHWKLLTSPGGRLRDRDEPVGSTLGRPEVGGFARLKWTPNLFQIVHIVITAQRNRLDFGRTLFDTDITFASFCRQNLHVADMTDPLATFVFGDYSHGPL